MKYAAMIVLCILLELLVFAAFVLFYGGMT